MKFEIWAALPRGKVAPLYDSERFEPVSQDLNGLHVLICAVFFASLTVGGLKPMPPSNPISEQKQDE